MAQSERELALAQAGTNTLAAAKAQLTFAQKNAAEARTSRIPAQVYAAEIALAEAEYAVAHADAAGDPLATARAQVKFTETALASTRAAHQQGQATTWDVERRQADFAHAKAMLDDLLKRGNP